MAPAVREPMLGYHPCSTGFLTCARDPGGGQCQAGSLTGAVASERVSEALKGLLRMVGNHPESAKAGRRLDCDCRRVEQVRKAGLSDRGIKWDCHRSTDKSYHRDNRLITPKSSHRRVVLAPRCRLIASWSWSRFVMGWAVRPKKGTRAGVQKRRETVQSYPGAGAGYLRRSLS